MTVAANIVLTEVDVELTLLGSLFTSPQAFDQIAGEINPAWFSDPLARYLFDECMRLQRAGNRLSTPVIISLLPEDCGGVSRGAFYARACTSALPAASLGGLVTTLKDRWARRELMAIGHGLNSASVLFEQDPFLLAQDAVLSLDSINASRAAKTGGMLDTIAAAVVESQDRPAELKGASTGIQALNLKLNGYKAGQLYVIAGRPGMGKSAFMCSSLRRTAETGKGVAIFSLEMTDLEVATRCMVDALDNTKAPTFGDVLRGLTGEDSRADLVMARDSMEGLPLYVDASPRLTFSEIAARARQIKARMEAEGRKLAVVCIDHMGLVTPSDRYSGNKVAEAGEVSGGARALAKELDCCVVLLCQLNRAVEGRDDKRPTLADLRWSGDIEQDAHVVAFLYREAYYLAQDPNVDPYRVSDAKFNIDFLIRKNRNGPSPEDVRLWCSISHSSVRDA